MRHAIDQWLGQSNPNGTYRSSFGSGAIKPQSIRAKASSTTGRSSVSVATANQATDIDAVNSAEVASTHRLSNLLGKVRFFAGDEIEFTSIASSAQTCQPGQLVVYRLGLDCPVELIADALARGAAGILTEQVLPAPLPQAIVVDTDRALAEIRSAQNDRPDQKLITIGVVGSAGKTITSLLIASVLRDIPCRVAYQTDLGSSDSIMTEVATQALGGGAVMLDALSDAVDAGAAVNVMELNASALRSGAYDQIELDVVVVTGRDAARTDFGPSAIECAFERVATGGVLVVPESDGRVASIARQATANNNVQVVTYGVDCAADVSIKTVTLEDGTLTALLRNESRAAVMESFLGRGHFAECLAAAAAVGVVTENPLPQIAESLSKLRDVPGRYQAITTGQWDVDHANPMVRLDIAGTPERAEFALRAARQELNETLAHSVPMAIPMKSKTTKTICASRPQLWCVLAVSSRDDADTLMRYGQMLETMPDHCVLTCEESDKAKFLAMSHGVLDGVQNIAAMRLVADATRAIQWAHGAAGPNDMVVVLGGIDRSSPDTERRSLDERCQAISAFAEERSSGDAPASGGDLSKWNTSGGDETPSLKIFDGT